MFPCQSSYICALQFWRFLKKIREPGLPSIRNYLLQIGVKYYQTNIFCHYTLLMMCQKTNFWDLLIKLDNCRIQFSICYNCQLYNGSNAQYKTNNHAGLILCEYSFWPESAVEGEDLYNCYEGCASGRCLVSIPAVSTTGEVWGKWKNRLAGQITLKRKHGAYGQRCCRFFSRNRLLP